MDKSDILTAFQNAEAAELAKRAKKETTELNLGQANLDAIQPILDVREVLGNVIIDNGYPVAKAFYVVLERPATIFCFLSTGLTFDAACYVNEAGDLVSRINLFEPGKQGRTDSPDGTADYFIQWIAQHEQVKG